MTRVEDIDRLALISAFASRAALAAAAADRARSAVPAIEQSSFFGRPYSRWRNDPELARTINDRLAGPILR